jgi:hypothetical protein
MLAVGFVWRPPSSAVAFFLRYEDRSGGYSPVNEIDR